MRRALASAASVAALGAFSPAGRSDGAPPSVAVRRPDAAFLDRAHDDVSVLSRRALYEAACAMSAWDSGANHEIGWRLARAAHQLATSPATPAAEKRALLERAHRAVSEAKARLRTNPAVFRWSGIILSDLSSLQGTKSSIEAAFAVRDDWREAVTLDPDDASAHHLLGRWAFRIVRERGRGGCVPNATCAHASVPHALHLTPRPSGAAGLLVPLARLHLYRGAARVQPGRGAGTL